MIELENGRENFFKKAELGKMRGRGGVSALGCEMKE